MIGNLAIAARQVLGARELIREHGRQQILGVHALELRRLLLAVAKTAHGERRARVPAPVDAEQRRVEHGLRQHVAHGVAVQVVHDLLEREAVHGAERQHDRVLERGGLQLEVEASAKALAQRQAPRAVDARAERRMHDEVRVAGLVEEALEHDALRRRQHAERGLRGAQVLDELRRGAVARGRAPS